MQSHAHMGWKLHHIPLHSKVCTFQRCFMVSLVVVTWEPISCSIAHVLVFPPHHQEGVHRLRSLVLGPHRHLLQLGRSRCLKLRRLLRRLLQLGHQLQTDIFDLVHFMLVCWLQAYISDCGYQNFQRQRQYYQSLKYRPPSEDEDCFALPLHWVLAKCD